MPRPSYGYTSADGSAIPGVTTVIGRFDDKSFLIDWANKQGLAGVSTKDIRNAAFADGKEIHKVYENVIKQRPVDIRPEHQGFVDQLIELLKSLEITDILSEVALISEVHRFGGTPDLIIKTIHDESVILDFKFANYIGVGLAYQMGAYRTLIRENMRRDPARAIGIHLNKKEFKKGVCKVTFVEIKGEAFDFFTDTFLKLRQAYDVVKEGENRFKTLEKALK